MAKRAKLNPNRFKKGATPVKPVDERGLFPFDPIRRDVFKWGVVGGMIGGIFMLRPEILWQIVGVLVVVFMANYHINKASQQIPRWHATIVSFLGVIVAIVFIVVLNTIVGAIISAGGGA